MNALDSNDCVDAPRDFLQSAATPLERPADRSSIRADSRGQTGGARLSGPRRSGAR
jgi:hypothetical protein